MFTKIEQFIHRVTWRIVWQISRHAQTRYVISASDLIAILRRRSNHCSMSNEYFQPNSEQGIRPFSVVPDSYQSLNSQKLTDDAYLAVPLQTLRLGEKKNANSLEFVSPNNAMARIYSQNKDGIVRITVKENDGTSLGTGFFVNESGRVATAAHVVEGAKSITVESSDGQKYSAHVVPDKEKPSTDLALLDIDDPGSKTFHPLKLAETSTTLKYGDPVYVLGHPQGWKQTFVSPGSFNLQETSAGSTFNPQLLNLSAFIHVEPGNSGGPLFNNKGEVVGVTRTKFDTDAIKDASILKGLLAETPLQSNYTRVDELRNLMGLQKPAATEDYFVPKALNLGADTAVMGTELFASAAGSLAHMRNAIPARGGWIRGIALPIFAGAQLNSDYAFFQSALDKGSTAEVINGGINVAADAMVIAGAGMMVHPKLAPVAGAVQLGGTGIKFVNQLLADRRYD